MQGWIIDVNAGVHSCMEDVVHAGMVGLVCMQVLRYVCRQV